MTRLARQDGPDFPRGGFESRDFEHFIDALPAEDQQRILWDNGPAGA
jgi:hypothetical protein